MIAIERISFSYTKEKPLFTDFSWTVQPGETWSVLGMSGCGKPPFFICWPDCCTRIPVRSKSSAKRSVVPARKLD